MSRVYEFLTRDHGARWRALLWSWAAGTVMAIIAAMARASTDETAILCVSVSLCGFAGFLIQYVRVPRNVLSARRETYSRRALLDYAYAACLLSFIAVIERLLSNPETVHAAVIHATAAAPEGKAIPEGQLLSIRSKVVALLKRRDLNARVRAQARADYARLQGALMYLAVRSDPFPIGRGSGTFVIFSPPAPTHMIDLNFNKRVYIRTVNLIATTPGSWVLDPCSDCEIVLKNVLIKGFTQRLDHIAWLEVTFESCTLSYSEGPLTLVDVVIRNCAFDISTQVPSAIRNVLINSDPNNPITLTTTFPPEIQHLADLPTA
mgnify:CR=1 FL=1